VPMQLLSWEVTETAAVANIVRAETLIRRLRDLGCNVALDDFGRGLSSLAYLKALPVTHLKIDGTFVRDVVGDERTQAMLSAIVQLARAMGLQTVAECVESEEIRAITARLGVEYGQGFSIGRPMPFERVLNALVGVNIPGRIPQTA
jgi:ammonium transporter, Amt family